MATKRKILTESVDTMLLAVVLVLLAYGLLALYSATFYVGVDFWRRQLIWVGAGLLAMTFMYWAPYTIWQKMALGLMLINLALLLVLLIFGTPVFGALRSLLGRSVQPGVAARLVAVVYIAAWLASKGDQLNKVNYGLFPFGVIMGIVAGLVALQPDLSTAVLIAVTGLAMFFFAGGDPVQIFVSVVIGAAAFGFLAWQFPHARQRLLDYVVSLRDPSEMPYHVHRAILAISEGGVFGTGLGSGKLKFGYLPFPHTDSIFAVIGEEAGLIGTMLVLALFGLLTFRGFRVTLGTPDPFGSLLAFGVTVMIVSEALLNVMVMIGLIPFTGTALPFFSYGGSEMLVTLSGIGLLLGVSRGRPRRDWNAVLDRWGRNWRSRLSRARRDAGFARHRS
ncbi:MAG: FtsW/RodA/SpoVE family cell cycle protein [Anaerolineae bacterium]